MEGHPKHPGEVLGQTGSPATVNLAQVVIGVSIIASATAAAWHGIVTGDALVGLYGSVLGYIYGIGKNGNGNNRKTA